jgi:hypothetical protein
MRHVLLMAVRLALTGISLAGSPDTISSSHDGDLASIRSLVPADHPEGNKAKVTLISVKRMETLHDSILSTFIVDYAPGGSAILHHKSAPGYVVVHVLSGAIRAQAWGAGVGTYRAGQTWTAPAFADDIASKNTSQRVLLSYW